MAIRKRYVSPRQKMINLLYVVLMAMLAINVSSDVVKGYSVMYRALDKSTGHSVNENRQVLSEIEDLYKHNPVKTDSSMAMAIKIRNMADSLFVMADSFRQSMIESADGTYKSDLEIVRWENMDVSNRMMVKEGRSKELADCLQVFRSMVLSVMPEGRVKAKVADCLMIGQGQWWIDLFSDMPLAGAVTLLSKIQNDVRYAEGEALHALLENIDPKDIRTNRLAAFVIPEARSVVEGDRYKARIVLAAVDSTQMPEIFIDGRKKKLSSDEIELVAGGQGEHSFSGRIVATDRYGGKRVLPFKESYTVMEPMSNVTSSLMKVLYAGYDNYVEVSASGVSPSEISVSAAGCSVVRKGEAKFIIKPSANLVGKDLYVQVTGKTASGRMMDFSHKFRVRALPMPLPFVVTQSGKFAGGKLSRGTLLSTEYVGAAVDDGILDIPYKVLSFNMVFFDNLGNAKVYPSNSDRMTNEQLRIIQGSRRNSRCYISSIRAKGPDGITRVLQSSMELIFK